MAEQHRRSQRRASRQADTLASEVAAARAGLGASAREVARRAGVSPASVRRVESGNPATRFDTMCAVADSVGIDVVLRPYRSEVHLRDSGQLRVAELIRAAANPIWQVQLEIPSGDHGEAIDVCCFGPSEILAMEIDRLVADFQGTHRRNVTKRAWLAERHERPVRLVMVVEDTRRNRDAFGPHRDLIRSVLPAGPREILGSIRTGRPLGRDGLLWIRPYRALPAGRVMPA